MKPASLLALVALVAAGLGPAGAGTRERGGTDLREIDAALGRAARFLVSRQSPDGAWRSETYGCFREVPVLTPYVMSTLFFLDQGGPEVRRAFRRGVDFLLGMVAEDGTIREGPRGFDFPVYTATMASRVVVLDARSERHRAAQAAWLAHLRRRQLTEALGWSPEDPEYGGWGFSHALPRKPAAGEPRERFFESNLSATLFGLAALRSARVPLDDPSWKAALTFVSRCQNFPGDPADADERFDDGGFFFIPGDPLQNKAGIAGTDRRGRTRFHSYGSMTADGLRALLQCGLAPDHPRVAAARRWLERSFSPSRHPGEFARDREVLRGATHYYYLWSAAHAFMRLGVRTIETEDGPLDWAPALAAEIVARQREDGSWTNRFTDAREDDPLIATPWAAAALAIARRTMAPGPRAD